MRKLLYVPIIHEEVDLGTLGVALARESFALAGEGPWAAHRETVLSFWERVSSYLRAFDPRQLVLYQDGMVTDGDMGRRIVEEGSRRGSRNYQLLGELLKGGARLRKTEDLALVLQEHMQLQASGSGETLRQQRCRLMEQRDLFIAGAINGTLREDELGVLFLGAQHMVAPRLDADIQVAMLKDPQKLRQYIRALLVGRDPGKLQELAQYLTASISLSSSLLAKKGDMNVR